MQAFSLLHAAEFSIEKHDHNGQVCEICLSSDHNKLLNGELSKLVNLNLLTLEVTLPKESLLFFAKVKSFSPRSPPFFS